MRFFSRSNEPDSTAQVPTKVDLERIKMQLEKMNYKVNTDGDRLAGKWNGHVVMFAISSDEWLISSIIIEDIFDQINLELLLQATDAWNRDHVFPTLYPINVASGKGVQGDCVYWIHAGLSDQQLMDFIELTLSSGMHAAKHLAQFLPLIDVD